MSGNPKKKYRRAVRTHIRSGLDKDIYFNFSVDDTLCFRNERMYNNRIQYYKITKKDNKHSKKSKNKKPWQNNYVNYDQANQEDHPKKNSHLGNQHWKKSISCVPDNVRERYTELAERRASTMHTRRLGFDGRVYLS